MGRQTGLHMLERDCKLFMDFLHERDPVVIIIRDANTPEIAEVLNPCDGGAVYCIWNQALLPSLKRRYISTQKPYYGIDMALPVIEFSYPSPMQEPWNGYPALTQGRIWASFESQNKSFGSWYNAIVRWIRKTFVRSPVPLGGYIGPAAYDWYKKGGILLPVLRPPVTAQWLSWVDAQHRQRHDVN